jgi:tRNA-splicing ligase RtcB
MKVLKEGSRLPIKMWLDEVESNAMRQAINLSQLPFAFRHIVLMPDCHMGYGMPIGGVLATKDVIIPNAVGVDIGCGMCAVKTTLSEIDIDTLKKIMGKIRQVIPVGFKKHDSVQSFDLMPEITDVNWVKDEMGHGYGICQREFVNAQKSLGTLGGGNHFIEIQKADTGNIWIMLHSGSRNLGKKVADHYNKLAVELNKKYFSQVPKEWELAFLPIDSEEGQNYIKEMRFCVEYALANRKLMMDRIKEIFGNAQIPGTWFFVDRPVNIAHNYASLENHFSQNVWLHRKGATLAREDTIGVIPGSQGSMSYIVKGLGNRESFMSCSHGAGRKMGRKQAQRELNLDKEIDNLNTQGIIHSVRTVKDLDEAPGAYKNIYDVMQNQKDLVKILVKLSPLAVIKG